MSILTGVALITSLQVATLSVAQFLIELQKLPKAALLRCAYILSHFLEYRAKYSCRNTHSLDSDSQPLLAQPHEHALKSVKTRPRSKSKPDDIFIHPAESNIARADAVALELGLAGDTDRVKGYSYTKDAPAWEIGKGKDMAREMLMSSNKPKPQQAHREPFYINDSDSEASD